MTISSLSKRWCPDCRGPVAAAVLEWEETHSALLGIVERREETRCLSCGRTLRVRVLRAAGTAGQWE